MANHNNAVAIRLRAVKKAFGIPNFREFGEICEVTESVVQNWMIGSASPRYPEMIKLCERTGLTLDWIYRGAANGMDGKMAVTLGKIIDGKAD